MSRESYSIQSSLLEICSLLLWRQPAGCPRIPEAPSGVALPGNQGECWAILANSIACSEPHHGGALLEEPDVSGDDLATLMWKYYVDQEDNNIVDLTVGQVKSCLKCQACGYLSTTFEDSCDLPIPESICGWQGVSAGLFQPFHQGGRAGVRECSSV